MNNRPICGDWAGPGDTDRAKDHPCGRTATRISHLYEAASVYVCDAPFEGDHEWAAPWLEDTIEDLPYADAVRALEKR